MACDRNPGDYPLGYRVIGSSWCQNNSSCSYSGLAMYAKTETVCGSPSTGSTYHDGVYFDAMIGCC